MTLKPRLLVLFFIILIQSACQQQGILKTSEGIPRKVIIRQNDTPLYASASLNNQAETSDQWEVLYVFGESDSYYIGAGDMHQYPETPYYVRKSDVFEWNSYFCLTYKDSPHETGRQPVKIYKTLEGAKIGDKDDVVIQEKDRHRTSFLPIDANPILRDNGDSIYYIASLYDDIDEEGNYVFLGHYDFGYVKYNQQAHEFRRYVSKTQLAEQLRVVLGIVGEARNNLNPSEVDKLYGPLIGLLAEFDSLQKGVEDIVNIFQGGDVPSAAQIGPFDPEAFLEDVENLDPQLAGMADKMLDHLENPKNWNKNGYTYIPAEWMDQ